METALSSTPECISDFLLQIICSPGTVVKAYFFVFLCLAENEFLSFRTLVNSPHSKLAIRLFALSLRLPRMLSAEG